MKRSIFSTGKAIALLIALPLLFAGSIGVGFAQADNDTLIVAVSRDIQNIDPTLTSGDRSTWELLTNVYGWLIDYEVVDAGDGTMIGDPNGFVGGLAESWEWNADGTKVTFRLRDGLTFSNGDPLTAEAVKFTFDRLFDQQGVTVGNMAQAQVPDKEHIQLVDSSTIEMTLDAANTLLFGNMAQSGNSILNPNVVGPHMTDDDPSAHEWIKSNTAGTEQGPYRLESWDPGNQYVLARNDNYWGEPAKLERIIFKIIPDPSSRLAQLVSGAVDMAWELPTIDIQTLEANPDITVHRNTSRIIGKLGMNNNVPPFDNVLVRQAVSYAIPYDTIVNDVMNGYAIQLTSPVPTGTPTHTDDAFHYTLDLEKAKSLLDEAGFSDGFETTLEIPIGNQAAKETAVFVQQSLGEIGIEANIQELPGAAFFERLQKHELGFFFADFWISINNDPFYHLFWKFQSDCCNYTDYQNEVVDELIDTYTINTDEEARTRASIEAQTIIVDEAPWVFLFQPEHIVATRSNVKGYVFYSADSWTRYYFLYKE